MTAGTAVRAQYRQLPVPEQLPQAAGSSTSGPASPEPAQMGQRPLP